MPELPPKPTPEEFGLIARAIAPHAEVISTRQLTGGISCRMDILTFAPAPGETRNVVVRQYGPWHRDDRVHPRVLETAVLKTLSESGISAPELILGDDATRILGRPTIVTSLIDGIPKVIAPNPTDWAAQLVTAIAGVHSIPGSQKMRTLIPPLYSGFERSFSRASPPEKIAEHPLGTSLWQVLKEQWTEVDRSAQCLVHADYWPGNTLWKDEKLVAIVDWEEPRLGEPTWDIATIVQDAACFGMDVEEAVLEQYEQISIRPLRNFRFWRMLVAMNEMPDPGEWAEGHMAMGGNRITPDEVRGYHTASIKKMLDEL